MTGMSITRFVGAACALLSTLSGCGGSKPEPVAVPAAQPPAAPAPAPIVALEPATAPPGLFAIGRITDASKLADTAILWSGLPTNWRDLLTKEVPGFDRIAALGAPIDFAAALDPASEAPRVFRAFAFGVGSVDAAASFFRGQGYHVAADSGGYRIENGTLACLDVPALGASPARVVCSDEADGVNALAPYMARGLPSESFGASEVHIHVLAAPFRKRYSTQLMLLRTMGVSVALRELSLDYPKFDRALSDVLYPLADELIALGADIDRLDLDMTLTPNSDALDTNFVFALDGQQSFTGQALARSAGKGGPAPDIFWRLPGDATGATYSAYSDGARLRGIASSLRALLVGWLDYEQLSDVRQAALGQAFEDMLTLDAHSAYATLPILPSNVTGSTSPADRMRQTIQASLSGGLFIVDRNGDRFTRFASELVKSLDDKGFRAHLVKSKLVRAEQIPTARERGPRLAKGLPSGTKVFEFTLPGDAFGETDALEAPSKGKKRAAAQPLSVFFVAVPDGSSTWFGYSTDEKAIEDRLAGLRAGTASRLDKRDGLASLRSDTALTAGFSTLEALSASLAAAGDFGMDAFSHLPHHGETPMLWHTTSDARGPRATWTGRIPKEVVQDAVALAATAATHLGK